MKKILQMLIVCISAISMTSCEETVSSIYYMSPGDSSVNYSSNYYIKALVLIAIQDSDGSAECFTGTESKAIEWFDSKCNEMLEPSFIEDIPVADDSWVDMELIQLTANRVAKTTRLTFAD